MKITRHLLLFQMVSLLIICSPVHCPALDLQVQPGVTFDWWEDNHNVSATQLTFPLQFTGTHDDLSFRLMTAYTITRLSLSGTDAFYLQGSNDITMSGLLDTRIGATYRLSNMLPFELLLGLDLNLPTGKTNLSTRQTLLIMDPDLLPINTYGEGFNVNPTITIAKGWGTWTFALGMGYLWRGPYDYSEAVKDYQQGEVFNAIAEARYYYRPDSYARIFAGYTMYGTDTINGRDTFGEGDVLLVGGSVYHALLPELKVSAGVSGTFRQDATVYGQTFLQDATAYGQTLGIKQDVNAFNGTETVIDLAGSYALNSKTVLSIPVQIRLIADNDNPTAYHVGAKEKVSLGVGVTREIIPMLTADLSLKGFYKHDDATEIPEKYGERHFTGIGVAASITGRF